MITLVYCKRMNCVLEVEVDSARTKFAAWDEIFEIHKAKLEILVSPSPIFSPPGTGWLVQFTFQMVI